MEISNILLPVLRSFIVGFAVVIPIFTFIKPKDSMVIDFKNLFLQFGLKTVRAAGVLYVIFWIWGNSVQKGTDVGGGVTMIKNDIFGPYWAYFWFTPIMYLLLTQLFWLRKIYERRGAVIAICILLLTLPSQRLQVLAMNNFGKHNVSIALTASFSDVAVELGLSIIIFFFMVFMFVMASGKLKKTK